MTEADQLAETLRSSELAQATEVRDRILRSAELDRRQRRLRICWIILGFVGGAVFAQGPAGLSTTAKYIAFYLIATAMVGAILTGYWRDHALNPEGGWRLIAKKNLALLLLCAMQFFLPLASIGNYLWAKVILFTLLSLAFIEIGLGAFSLGSGKRRSLLGVIDYRR